jgi:transcriptional regulator with XRE-family HTH domain
MMKSSPNTARDVARRAGVSTATVSRVLNNTGKVSGDKRERVLSAIAHLQYRPDVHAVELRRGKADKTRKRGNYHAPIIDGRSEFDCGSRAEDQSESWDLERIRSLEAENARLRRVIANLSRVLEREKQRVTERRPGTRELKVGADLPPETSARETESLSKFRPRKTLTPRGPKF